jgi:hypothetical protein
MRSLGLDAPSGNKSTIQYLTDNSTFGGYSGDRAAEISGQKFRVRNFDLLESFRPNAKATVIRT